MVFAISFYSPILTAATLLRESSFVSEPTFSTVTPNQFLKNPQRPPIPIPQISLSLFSCLALLFQVKNLKMVARISKRTPTKTIKAHRRHRKKSPSKTAATIISSINRSLSTCKRRIAKLFSELVRITTPSRKSSGYKILKTQQQKESGDQFLAPKVLFFDKEQALPPLISPDRRTIFLDLDETLVHSQPDPPPKRFDFIVRPTIDGEMMSFYVIKRPGVDAFLESISENYEVVVFTAGLKEYASLVLDRLDKKGLISHRLYRDSCKQFEGKLVKDLSEVGRDLKKTVIVDDNPNAYQFQPENAIPLKPFVGEKTDLELLKLMTFFQGCQHYVDMRDAVKEFVSFKEFVGER